tara:strand:- start:863 stop:1141 length:279 start_codon:yes stop_codon:yes gene_type:complete
MTPDQQIFASWLEENAPYLMPLFNFEKREYLPEKVERYFSVCSRGEEIMARFFLSVWRNDDHFNFQLIDAVKGLDSNNLRIINEWLESPKFP